MTKSQGPAIEKNLASLSYRGETYQLFHPYAEDHILRRIQNSGTFYEAELLEMLRPVLNPGDLVVDVGANIGNHSVFFAGVCDCRVLAVEPHPTALEGLRRNIELNALEDLVSILPYAAGAEAGLGRLSERDADNIGTASIRVDDNGSLEIRSLDTLIKEGSQPRLIKIDVEGMEKEVLSGAMALLRASRPILALEAATIAQFSDIEALIGPLGYAAVGSLNYTPTHVFVAETDEDGRKALSSAPGRRFALQHIDQMRRQASTDANLSELRHRVNATEAETSQTELKAALQSIETKMEEMADVFKALIRRSLEEVEGTGKILSTQQEQLAILEQYASQPAKLIELRDKIDALEIEAVESRLKHKIDGVLKAQLLVGRAVDGAQIETRRLLKEQLPHEVSQELKAVIAENIATMTDRVADAIGKALGEGDYLSLLHKEGKAQPVNAAEMVVSDATDAAEESGNVWLVKGAEVAPVPGSSPTLLAELDMSQTWKDLGWAQGEARLDDGGVVAADKNSERIGVVSRYIDCQGGGLLEVEVETAFDGDSGRRFLRVQSENGEAIGHDFTLHDGVTRVRVFAAARVERMRIFLLVNDAKAGATLNVGSIWARRLPPEAHQKEVSRKVAAPVIASMASIPNRREMLADCVASLLVQCDKVRVFLNNYDDVPSFLDDPRIEVKRSQDWDDRGDAGKFFWIDKEDHKKGYRLIVDDDLIFPPNFVTMMTGKVSASDNRAIYATHAILLRQPFEQYYDDTSRAETFHFGHRIQTDRGVHIGATNAMCFHASAVEMRWDDFKYCNSADIWLSLYAQKHSVPILTPERPVNWVIENRQEAPNETIYAHALKRTKTRFDSSIVQDAMLRRESPLTIQPLKRKKFGLFIEAADASDLRASVEAWLATCKNNVEWVLVLICPRTDPAYVEVLKALKIPNETHVLDTNVEAQPRRASFALHEELSIDASIYVSAGASLTVLDNPEARQLNPEQTEAKGGQSIHLWLNSKNARTEGVSFSRTQTGINQLHDALSNLRIVSSGLETLADFELSDFSDQPSSPTTAASDTPKKLNDVFERVQVINLDRRPDRWERTSMRLAAANVSAERFSAVDGKAKETLVEFEAYNSKPLVTTAGEVKPVVYSEDLYIRYESQNARIAHIEQKSKAKAIASAGAWGYLRSYEQILEAALADQVETLMIFDDDVSLHKNFEEMFAAATKELPDDWLILQLGTLQYNWEEPWMNWVSPKLYQTSGVAIGSHAVGIRFEIMPYLLDHVKRMDLPFDVGALSAAVRAFADRCYVIHPNLVIQSLGESEISTSEFQKSHTTEEIAELYRWRMEDYDGDLVEQAENFRRERR